MININKAFIKYTMRHIYNAVLFLPQYQRAQKTSYQYQNTFKKQSPTPHHDTDRQAWLTDFTKSHPRSDRS